MQELINNFGFFSGIDAWAVIAVTVALSITMAYTGAPLWLWALAGYAGLAGLGAPLWLFTVYTAMVLVFNIKPVRRSVVSTPIMNLLDALNFLPTISETEQTAIEAGTVWVEGELFSGKPDFERILNEDYPELSEKEKAFVDGPVEELCAMVSDWDVMVRKDFTEETWDFMRKNKFFGLIIPEKYGGLNFSATGHSAIVAKLASRCGPLATTVMVPNSLGPAELLLHYGTEEQKDRYLPGLASGEEIPCFALTEPYAGSDAGAMRSEGEVIRGEDGELYLRLNWNKRYITLAAISTVIGLAFKLRDPDHLLGDNEDLGITCALIPSDTEGVILGKRHDPLGIPFYNCPTRGENVVVPLNAIIGGKEQAGNGWRMLMESLAVGRGISLPAQSAGGSKVAARSIGAYAAIRQQFGLNIGKFEGIEEPMARIGGYTYLLEAARRYTTGGLDQGAKPAVVTAIAKYNFTEMGREIVNDAMDIVGGAGISRGPRNIFSSTYQAMPIAITVEGANILTRTLMIFGQGAIRCHPYAYNEIEALMNKDAKAFDDNFWAHIGHVGRNKARAFMLSLTRGYIAATPISGPSAKYIRRLNWASASFAFFADIAMGSYGGGLKMKEKIAGRYADILSFMYLGAAVIKRFEAEGRKEDDRAFFEWSMEFSLYKIQEAFDGILQEIKVPGLSWLMRLIGLWSRMNPIGTKPSDELGHKVAQAMQIPGEGRDRLTEGMFLPQDDESGVAKYEKAFMLTAEAQPLYKKLYKARKAGDLPKEPYSRLIEPAAEKGILSLEEADLMKRVESARGDAIQVDEFSLDEYERKTPAAAAGKGFPEKEIPQNV